MTCRRRSSNQLSITKMLTIPENKPDIERLLRVTSTPEICSMSTIKGKVVLTGEVCVLVEYVAISKCNTQPIHFASFKIPFAHFIDHKCAQPWKDPSVRAEVEFQEVQKIDRRSLNIFLILLACIRKLESSKVIIRPQVFTPSCRDHSGFDQPCVSDCINDCTDFQPCSCASCTIECDK